MDNRSDLDLIYLSKYKNYMNLLQIYYDKNSICPINSKLKLYKKHENNKIYISCDDNKFSYEIKLPEYHNIYDDTYCIYILLYTTV